MAIKIRYITPSYITTSGGTVNITIANAGVLLDSSYVLVDSVSATINSWSNSNIEITAPVWSAAEFVDITVSTSGDTDIVENVLEYILAFDIAGSSLPDNDYFVANEVTYDKDRSLYDSLLMECYNKFGVKCDYYVVSYDTDYDDIFAEDMDRQFTNKFEVMTFYELPREEEMFSQYGIEGLDVFKINISKKHLLAGCATIGLDNYLPKLGDIIRARFNGMLYEITHVRDEVEMFLQGKHTWELTVQRFKNNHFRVATSAADDLTTITGYSF